jgi:hypothetical protein
MRPSRRTVLALAAALGLGPAAAQDGSAHYGSIAVDVGPLRARGLGSFAEALRGDLEAALRAAFADRTGPGPRLVVRITGVSLNAYAGSDSRPGRGAGSGMNNDYLEGEALVVGAGGEVLVRHPQLSVTPASYGGAWYDPESERRRLTVLAQHYAQWLRRAL